MGLRPRFTKRNLQKQFRDRKQALYNAILANLLYLGELCVNHARSTNTYRDQTGNLRSSIGYVIVYNGKVIKSAFSKAGGLNTAAKTSGEGFAKGRELANELAAEIGLGWALIVVAGMNYALAVESRGLDVLSSAEHLLEDQLPGMLAALKLDVQNLAALE